MISDPDARRLRELQRAANEEYQRIAALPRPARDEFYKAILDVADSGASYRDLAQALGIGRARVGQIVTRARTVQQGLDS
jgi:DNA-directed RNA polymerase specialized sigma24 family protein